MTRPILNEAQIHPAIREKINSYKAEIMNEVQSAIAAHDIVIVGMKQNPVVRTARKLLDDAKQPYHYIEYGSYLSRWRDRLVLKMWTGWPTFPMVFVKGSLMGGAEDLKQLMDANALTALLK